MRHVVLVRVRDSFGESLTFFSVKQNEMLIAYSKPNEFGPLGNESPSCLDEIINMNDGPKHDGMAPLFS